MPSSQIRMDTTQVSQAKELHSKLHQELELLTAYQCKIKMQASTQHRHDVEELKSRVSLRRKALKEKVGVSSGADSSTHPKVKGQRSKKS